MTKDQLREVLGGVHRDPSGGCWTAPEETAEEVRELLWEHVNGKPTRGKRPIPWRCSEPLCVRPDHQELTEEKRALRVPRVCGECAYIRYKGHQLITLEGGTCNQWRESGRLAVQSCADGCDLWTRRSKQRRDRDKNDHSEAATFARSFNQGVTARRRRG
jgi:hypothetical protein